MSLAVLGVVGSLVSTVGAISQASYQAAVARNNAEIARQNAGLAAERTQEQAKSNDEKTAALIGEQLAVQSASGLDSSKGSTLRVRQSTNRLGRQDTLNIRKQGSYDIQNYLQQAANFDAEAGAASTNTALAGLSGAVDVASGLMKSPSLISSASTTRMANRLGQRDPWITQSGQNLRLPS